MKYAWALWGIVFVASIVIHFTVAPVSELLGTVGTWIVFILVCVVGPILAYIIGKIIDKKKKK